MGATKPALTESKKEQYWGEAHNKRRRERYQNDPAYRAEVLQRARQTQFESRRASGFEVREGEDCRRNLPMLDALAKKRGIEQNGVTIGSAKMITSDQLAQVLGRDLQVLYRWMHGGMLPRPLVEARNERNRLQSYYTLDEARAIVTFFGEHQQTSLYFRSTHIDTILRIKQAVALARQKME
ncbi:hypothetical protein SB781_27750 [Paraburkholderia sp. SIMBA_061]